MKLSAQAKEILRELHDDSPKEISELVSRGFDQAMVNRAALELEEKGLAEMEEDEELVQQITEKGKSVMDEGSPEYQLLEKLREGPRKISELDVDADVAIGKAKQRGWIRIEGDTVELKKEGERAEFDPVKKKLQSDDFDDEIAERGLVETHTKVRKLLNITGKGSDLDLDNIKEEFNVEARVDTPVAGKKHFYRQIMDHARDVWLEMGFEEMSGDYIVPGLLNFDALYIPQDHPARELQDTFFMENPKTSDISGYGDKVDHIRRTHEDGWETGSNGWKYEWSYEDAERNVLRTHTTSVSARRLHEIDINEEELPRKFFTLGRVFRNETVDRTHNAEFYQTDGIVVGEELNFANLKGYISEFFEKMGYDEFRLIPTYYPYTEMSVEVQVWDEEDEEWLGMGGAGMFRPEVVKPLLGFEAPVLAWGLGIPRIAMIAAELDDVRELYRNDIEILEETPVWKPEKEVKN